MDASSLRATAGPLLVVLVVGLIAFAAQRVVGETLEYATAGALGSAVAVAALMLVLRAKANSPSSSDD